MNVYVLEVWVDGDLLSAWFVKGVFASEAAARAAAGGLPDDEVSIKAFPVNG